MTVRIQTTLSCSVRLESMEANLAATESNIPNRKLLNLNYTKSHRELHQSKRNTSKYISQFINGLSVLVTLKSSSGSKMVCWTYPLNKNCFLEPRH